MTGTLNLQLTGTLDPESAVFIMCLQEARSFPATSFTEYASRVETLVEIHENISCQRMMPESEEARS